MSYEAAKCPSCDANIDVENDLDTTKCKYCGVIVKVKTAINYMKVQVDGIKNFDTLIRSAETHFEFGETNKSLTIFEKLIEEYPYEWKSCYGLINIKTNNFSNNIEIFTTLEIHTLQEQLRKVIILLKKQQSEYNNLLTCESYNNKIILYKNNLINEKNILDIEYNSLLKEKSNYNKIIDLEKSLNKYDIILETPLLVLLIGFIFIINIVIVALTDYPQLFIIGIILIIIVFLMIKYKESNYNKIRKQLLFKITEMKIEKDINKAKIEYFDEKLNELINVKSSMNKNI